MRYPEFAAALRAMGATRKKIADLIGRSERQTDYYLAGNALPPADITARFPELHEALRRDLQLDYAIAA